MIFFTIFLICHHERSEESAFPNPRKKRHFQHRPHIAMRLFRTSLRPNNSRTHHRQCAPTHIAYGAGGPELPAFGNSGRRIIQPPLAENFSAIPFREIRGYLRHIAFSIFHDSARRKHLSIKLARLTPSHRRELRLSARPIARLTGQRRQRGQSPLPFQLSSLNRRSYR